MSAADRTVLAAAVASVDGLSCSPYFSQTTKAGTGFVRLDRTARAANGFGFMNTWHVLIVLPQDIATAEKYLEAKSEALIDALAAEGTVLFIEPREFPTPNGAVPVALIEVSREAA